MTNFAFSESLKIKTVKNSSDTSQQKRNYSVPVFLYILSVIVIILLVTVIQGFTDNKKDCKENIHHYSVSAVKIPEELDFAGEKVPLDNFDTRESLDRELLVNTYFHSQTFLLIKKSNRFFPVIEPVLKKNNIPDDFKYLCVIESGLDNSVSPKQAVGFWQLLEGTAKDYGLEINNEVDERYHLEKSTEVACKYLLESYEKYNNWTMAAASYNAGRRGMDRQLGRQNGNNYYDLLLNEETSRYIFRLLAAKLIITDPENNGFHLEKDDYYPVIPIYEVSIDSSVTDFNSFANTFGINYKLLKYFNPWLRETYLTNKSNKTYILKIPEKGYRSFMMLMKENADTTQ